MGADPPPRPTGSPPSAAILAHEERGSGTPVALVHGFAQTRRCLGPLVERLAGRHRTISLDAPGHGGSGLAEADLFAGATALAATLTSLAAAPAHLVGYSMGGRLCLTAAVAQPLTVRSLVLIGATAGIEDPAERASRRHADELLATRIEAIGVRTFCAEWLELDLFADLPPEARFEEERSRNDAGSLAASLRAAGTGAMEPLWDRLGELRVPVLCVTGARDRKFTSSAERMVERIGPAAQLVVVPDAGHAVHLVAPGPVGDAVSSFLAAVDEAAAS